MAEIVWIILALFGHAIYLFRTTFVDFPELLVYPWYIHQGMLPYRDFIIPYTPLLNYLLYPVYLLLGFSPTSERIVAYIVIFATDVVIYLLVKNLTQNRRAALISLVFYIFWQPIISGNTLWHETVMTPIFLVVYWLVVRHREKSSTRNVVIIGFLLALLTLMKQTTIGFAMVTVLFMGKRYIPFLTLTIAVSHVFVWGIFGILGAGSEYIFWVFGFLLHLSKHSDLYKDLPSRGDLFLILPSLVPMIFVRNRFLTALTIVLCFFAYPRWDLFRLQPMLAYIAVGVGYIASKTRNPLWMIIITFFVVIGSIRSAMRFVWVYDPMQPRFFVREYEESSELARKNIDGPFVALGSLEYLYFGTQIRPTIPVTPIFPWYMTLPGYEQGIVDTIDKSQIPFVFRSTREPEATLLDLYLEEKYEKIAPLSTTGGWLYRRK